jgi:hypothetical protein
MLKVLGELNTLQRGYRVDKEIPFHVAAFYDQNVEVYETADRFMTAIVVGPIVKSLVDSAIGHLELY